MPRRKQQTQQHALGNESLIPMAAATAEAVETVRKLWRPYLQLVPPLAGPAHANGNGNGHDTDSPIQTLTDPFQLVATGAAMASSWFDLLAINAAWMSNMARVMRGQRPE